LSGLPDGITIVNPATGDIAAGSSGTLTVIFQASQPSILSGSAVINLQSDGTGLDHNGLTPIGQEMVQLEAIVDNYAPESLSATTGTLRSTKTTNIRLTLVNSLNYRIS